jgi:gluconokinase
MRNTFRLGDDVEGELAALPPDGHGLTFLPFVAGERAPGWAADARAVISGLALHHRPIDLLRAGLEAVAYRFALIHERMREAAPAVESFVASGGALLRSPAWMQIMADVFGRPVIASGEAEAASRGAALLGLEALGAIPRVEDVPSSFGTTFVPDPGRREKYREGLARHRALYDRLVAGKPASA